MQVEVVEEKHAVEDAASLSTMKHKKMKSNVLRWAIHGVATELFHNVVLRTISRVRTRLFSSKQRRLQLQDASKYRRSPKREVAVVTGATGGIGTQMAYDLAFRGYDVVVAARDRVRGEALVEEIQGVLKMTPTKENESRSFEALDVPTITFVEYHADDPLSALNVASSITPLGPLTVLINNAGIMGKSKQLSMKVNLLGPAVLTFALLPLMVKAARNGECTGIPTVINVGSSAHLRATYVVDEETTTLPSGGNERDRKSWIDTLPEIADDDLSVYAQSKLALMQFSTLLRHWLPSDDDIRIYDAHPGLVWTPLLRNHIGDKAVGTLTKTGLAGLIYKLSSEGASAIVSALDHNPSTAASKEQVYFVNGKPGGYAASESNSFHDSVQLWKDVLAPEMKGVVELPEGWGLPS